MALPTLLIFDDNPDFGGHQVMTARALEGLVAEGRWALRGWYHPENVRNRERWEAIAAGSAGRFVIEPAPTRTQKFQALRNRFQRGPLQALEAAVRKLDPALVLVIQGNIEHSCSLLEIAPRLPYPVVSYIPLPHGHAEMGAKLGAWRDVTCRHLYARPDRFITISPTLAEGLVARGARSPVPVVENGIPLAPLRDVPSRAEARASLGLPEDAFIWGHVGRVEFKQKGQDFSVAAFERYAATVAEERNELVFVGSGPDDAALAAQIANVPAARILPWRDDLRAVYAAIDALLLPSRYEGVPLVMLEALALGRAVVSTDRDGMRDWLPESWRFAYRDVDSAVAAMRAVRQASPEVVTGLRDRVWSGHSVEAFQAAFCAALGAVDGKV